ncbi:MAG: hypothetical protein U0Q16_04530 [Bryobacteraceae bacterium]
MAGPMAGYHHFYINSGGTPVPVRWQTTANVFTADTDGPAGQNFTTLCTTATTTWNAVTDALDIFGTPVTSAVNFTGANLNTAWGNLTGDGKYELVYDANGAALTALGLDPASVNGYGPSRKRLVGSSGVIDDAFFVVTGTRTNFDLLSTLIHELGHIQGLAHSTVGMHTSATPETALDKIALNSVPTMHPFSLGTGNTSRRTLEPDDMASLRELYPESGAASRWASISGEVKRCGSSAAVVGANVRLISTTNSAVQISRFSSYDGNASGRYTMSFIPAGTYRVVVEPMGANGFTLNRFGSPPARADADFDFEYLSPSAVELACSEELPESAANIQNVAGTNGATQIGNDFRVGAPDLAFVVDDTGSMSEEIAAVRNILNNTITALQNATPARPFPLTAIVTFKDDVTKRIVSNNPTNLRTVVNALFASGGNDCPESSNAALLVAGRMLRNNGVAMLFTDADSRPDGPSRATVEAQYRAKGVRLFTLLSGTCTGDITPIAGPVGPVVSPPRPGRPSNNGEEYPDPAVNGSEPAVATFSNISNGTGGFFVAIEGINFGDTTETTRYTNTGTNLSISAVLPALALVTPTNAPRSATLNVEINGSNTNFVAGKSTLVFSGTGITVNSVTVSSPTLLTANISVAPAAALGFRDATVTTNLGVGVNETATGLGVLNVTTAVTIPTSISVTPSKGGQGQMLDATVNVAGVTLTGSSVADFGAGVTVMSNTLLNANTILAKIKVDAAATIGYRFVSVSTPGAGTATDTSPAGNFQVVASAPVVPTIISVTPNQVGRNATVNLTLTGLNTNFGLGTTVAVSGTGVTVNSTIVNSPNTLTVNVTVASAAALGFRDITATFGGQTASILNGIQIIDAGASSNISITAPTPSQVVNVSGVTFSWTVASGVTGYDLRVTKDGSLIFQGTLLGANSNSTLISLTEGNYGFQVRSCTGAFNDASCGVFAIVNFSVVFTAPTVAPTVTAPTNGQNLTNSTFNFQWTSVASASYYQIELINIAGGGTVELSLSLFGGPPPTSTIYTMPASSNYLVRVRGCTVGCGPWSSNVNFSVTLPAVPSVAPTMGSCSITSGNQLNCTWNAVTGADFYTLQVVQPTAGPGGGALTVASRQTTNTAVGPSDTVPVPCCAAVVFVTGCNGNGCGPYSSGTPVSVPGPNPGSPSLGTPLPGSASPDVSFSWNRVPGDNGSNTIYRLYVQDFSRGAPALDVLTTSNFYAAKFKADGNRYDALVVANPGLPSQVIGPPTAIIVHGTNPPSPTMVAPRHQTPEVTLTVPQGNVQLNWTPVPGATLYEYYVAVAGQGSPAARGITPGLFVQVPLPASGAPVIYSGIVRACPAATICNFGSDAGWGPWSNAPGGPGVTTFRVAP